MIDIIGKQDTDVRNLEGRYVLGGLPLEIGKGVWFLGTPLFVERSMPGAHHCRKIVVEGMEYGRALAAVLAPLERNDHSIRIKNDFVRYVCDTSDEVVNLINARPAIMEAMKGRGYLSDDEVRIQIAEIIGNVVAGEPELQPALR